MNRFARFTLLFIAVLAISMACRAFEPQAEPQEAPAQTQPIGAQPVSSTPLPGKPLVETPAFPTQSISPAAGTPDLAVPVTTAPTYSEKGGPPPTLQPIPQAVILVAPDDMLNVRQGPGPETEIIAELPPDAAGVILTGAYGMYGDQRWVEILIPGGTGWVNARYLTEYRSPAQFCTDPAVEILLDRLRTSVSSRNGEQLAALVSPINGLNLNYFHTGNRVHFSPEEVKNLFSSQVPVNWGIHPASGMDATGTFEEEVLPKLDEVLKADYRKSCNDPALGPNSYLFQWPEDYKNINFISLTKPGSPEMELDWRTWLVGVEYVDGVPYVIALMHLFWEP